MNYSIEITNTSFFGVTPILPDFIELSSKVLTWRHRDFAKAAKEANCDGISYDPLRFPILAYEIRQRRLGTDHGITHLRRSWRQEEDVKQAWLDTDRRAWSTASVIMLPHQRDTEALYRIQRAVGRVLPLTDYPAFAEGDRGRFGEVLLHIDQGTMKHFSAPSPDILLKLLEQRNIKGILDLASEGVDQVFVDQVLAAPNVNDIHIPVMRQDREETMHMAVHFVENTAGGGLIEYALRKAQYLGKQKLRITLEGSPQGTIELGKTEPRHLKDNAMNNLIRGYGRVTTRVREVLGSVSPN